MGCVEIGDLPVRRVLPAGGQAVVCRVLRPRLGSVATPESFGRRRSDQRSKRRGPVEAIEGSSALFGPNLPLVLCLEVRVEALAAVPEKILHRVNHDPITPLVPEPPLWIE